MAGSDQHEAVAHHKTVHLFQKPDETLDQFMDRLEDVRSRSHDAVGHPRVDTSLSSTPPAARVRQQVIDSVQSMLPPDHHLELIAEDLDDIFEDDIFEFGESDEDEDNSNAV